MAESFEHAILVDLFRTYPEVLVPLLRAADEAAPPDGDPGGAMEDAAGEEVEEAAAQAFTLPVAETVTALGPDLRIVSVSTAMTELASAEYRADVVAHFMVPGSDRPVHVCVVEIQRRRDPDKHFTWPTYAINLRQRARCFVTLVVVTLSERVARWAARSIPLGAGNFYRPVVIGPARIPRIVTLDRARAMPALAVLSAMAHGAAPGGEDIVRAALEAACPALDSERSVIYADFLRARFRATEQRISESNMKFLNITPESLSADDPVARLWMALGQRQLLARQLIRRFGPLPQAAVFRLWDATEEDIERWTDRIITATSRDEVFDGEG
jgi:hypothetical protein